jgi:hypothetical protein
MGPRHQADKCENLFLTTLQHTQLLACIDRSSAAQTAVAAGKQLLLHSELRWQVQMQQESILL